MIDCNDLSAVMPEVMAGRAEWSPVQAAHITGCEDCAAEWRLVRLGATLHSDLVPDSERLIGAVLSRLRTRAPVVPLRRLPWRNFVMGIAAAASVALVVWVPNREHEASVATLPGRIGLLLPKLSSVTNDQLDRISLASETSFGAGEAGAVPPLGGLSESDLTQLSNLTEHP